MSQPSRLVSGCCCGALGVLPTGAGGVGTFAGGATPDGVTPDGVTPDGVTEASAGPPMPGSAATGTPWCAAFMNRDQISTGKPPPVAFLVGEESSLPIQTPATRCAV